MARRAQSSLPLRTRPTQDAVPAQSKEGQQFAEPTQPPPYGQVIRSIERSPVPEWLTPHTLAEPMLVSELEPTPSPFIKREPQVKEEPEDKNTYSAFNIADDEADAYNPFSTSVCRYMAAQAPYDPARPVIGKLTKLSRILSTEAGNTFEPPTVCFTELLRNKQLIHVLKCHGEVETPNPVACGKNCQTLLDGDKTLLNHQKIICSHPICEGERAKRHASVFMPKRRVRLATPAIGVNPRRSSRLQTHDEKTKELNDLVANDQGYAAIAARAEGPGVRKKSKRHPGYANMKEIHEDEAAERLFKITNRLDLNLDENPGAKKVLRNLMVQGTDKLAGFGGTFGLKRKAADVAAKLPKHDKGVGALLDRDMPWSYANSDNTAPGDKAIRNEEAGMYSMPQTRYNSMLLEENEVVIEREDAKAQRMPRNQLDGGDLPDDEEAGGSFQTVEACGVCEVADDGQLEACMSCGQHFHPVCAGIGEDTEITSTDTRTTKDWHYLCDGEGCDQRLSSLRYKCFNVACQDRDFCLNCFRKQASTHQTEVAAKGDDPATHGFLAVRVEYLESLEAAKKAMEFGFKCRDCRETSFAQNLFKQMFRREEGGDGEDEGIRGSKAAVNKPQTHSRRHSNRLSGGYSLRSADTGGFKLKLTGKRVSDVMGLGVTADPPEIIRAEAQLQSTSEKDVEMTEAKVEADGNGVNGDTNMSGGM